MLKIKETTALAALAALLAAPFASTAATWSSVDPLENGIPLCGVPVCEMEKTIEKLRELNENQRYNYANRLLREHSKSQDETVLDNLVESAQRLKELSIELGDADWVVREASNLGNAALLSLTKHSRFEAKKILGYYKRLDSGAKRYEAISHYQQELLRIEDADKLSELARFAKEAQRVSVLLGDEAWISRAAESLAQEATVKLVSLEPSHEGIYTIKTKGNDGSVLDFDKIIVLDSTSQENLVVNFVNSKHKEVVFSYSGSLIVGNKVEGKMVSSAAMGSKFHFVFERESGAVKGELETSRGAKIQFQGVRVFSVAQVFEGQAPDELEEADALGTMKGSIMGIQGELSVHSFEPQVFSASFVADKGELKIDYAGKFYPEKGVLALTHKDKSKLVLALRKEGDKLVWKGVSYSVLNGKISKAQFEPLRQ